MKYAIVLLEEVNGEFSYTHKQVIAIEGDANLNGEGDKLAQEYFGQEDELEELKDGVYWDDSMERTIGLFAVQEITEEEYAVLKKFL